MRVREGRIPFLERHLARLERSLRALGLPRPARDVAALVTPFSGTGNAVLRVEVCDGRATVTVRELPALDAPAVITAAEPHRPYPHKTTERDCFVDAAEEGRSPRQTMRCCSRPTGGWRRGRCGTWSGGTAIGCARRRRKSEG